MGLQQQIEPIADSIDSSCIAVGTFDGVHVGHRSLLNHLNALVAEADIKSLVLSFRQSPRSIIDPSIKTPLLCSPETRAELIRARGVDYVQLIDFDDEIRTMTAEQFLATLQESVGMQHIVLGKQARIGHDQVDADGIAEIGRRRGFKVHTAAPLSRHGETVSSSVIRTALERGDVKRAAEMLGRLYERGGEVKHGKERAREMGVPTANMEWSRNLIMPAKGIYATWAKLPDGRVLPSGTYIGDNPTFGDGDNAFEVHIDNFNEDLYGQRVSVEFIEFIRPDIAFPSPAELNEAIQQDVEKIADIFANLSPTT